MGDSGGGNGLHGGEPCACGSGGGGGGSSPGRPLPRSRSSMMHTTFTGKTTEATAEGGTRAEYTPHTTEHSQAAGQKSLRLPLRERQLTGVKVRRRRRRRLLRLRHRRRRSLGGRKQGGRTDELRPSERAGRKEGFCAFFAASIRSLGGRGRLDRERGRKRDQGGRRRRRRSRKSCSPHPLPAFANHRF